MTFAIQVQTLHNLSYEATDSESCWSYWRVPLFLWNDEYAVDSSYPEHARETENFSK